METLRSDLLKVVQGSTELVRKAGNMQVPSWRFPEKLAVSLDVEETLKEGPSGVNSNIFFLELLIDRLLLLVQCSVQVLENTSSCQKSSGSPLTLGSAVKRVSKCILQSCAKFASLKEELSATLERVAFLESSLRQSRNETDPLIAADTKIINIDSCDTLKNSSNWMNLTVSTLSLHETTSISTQTTETVFGPCNHCFVTNLALVSTMQLVSEQCSKLQLHSKLASTNWRTQAEEVGRLDLVKWSEAYQLDMKSLEKSRLLFEEKVAVLVPEKYHLKARVCFMEKEIAELQEQINSLKVNIEKEKCHSKAILTNSKEEFATTLANLEEVRKELKLCNVELKSKLIASQKEVAILNATLLRLEAHNKKLKSDLHVMECHESELRSAKEYIDKQLELLVAELNRTREVLGDQQVELKKSKVYNESLENKNRTLREKQSLMLQRLDELDQECSLLKEEVIEVKNSREVHVEELQDIHICYQQVQQQLSERQRELSEACKEKEKLSDQISSFVTELATIRYQLESERLNCRLLMGFPFINQTDEAYADYIVSLIYKKLSHKQITANSIRIYLLEEQNNELRYLNLREAVRNRGHVCSHQNKIKWPVRLWKKDLINQLESKKDLCTVPVEQSSNMELFSDCSPRFKEALEHDSLEGEEVMQGSASSSSATENEGQCVRDSENLPASRLLTISSDKRSVSAEEHSSLKGHLGHLMRAIDSHRSSSADTSSESTPWTHRVNSVFQD